MDPLFWLTATLFGTALLLGGASQDAWWQKAVLEVLSLGVIGFALPRLRSMGELGRLRLPLLLACLLLLVPLMQLMPLPFSVWMELPGRGDLGRAMQRFGAAPASLPLSLTPYQTLNALLWLLIPIGVFLGAAACTNVQRSRLLLIVVATGLLSETLGLFQLSQLGTELRFYDVSNPERPVGLFANRNHQALFLLVGLPLAAAWIRQRRLDRARRFLSFGLLAALVVTSITAVVVSHSRAGLMLAVPAVAGVLLILFRTGLLKRGRALALGGVMILAFAVGTALLARSPWFVHRMAATESDYRQTIWAGALTLAERFSPLGSGLGSFAQVYMAVERAETLQAAYVNHAHNDLLEIWVDAGVIGLALALVLVVWVLWRSIDAWRSTRSASAMGQAASVVLALAAAHSLVDYPARTPAIAAVVALSCALLALPARRAD